MKTNTEEALECAMVQKEEGIKGSDWTRRQKLKRATATAAQTLVWAFTAAVLIMNFVLQRQNTQLKQIQSTLVPRQSVVQDLVHRIELGHRLGNIAGATLDEKFREINLASGDTHGTIIVTFSPECVHCLRNQPYAALLANKLKSQNWNVLWISRDSVKLTRTYCKAHEMNPDDVIADPTQRTYYFLGLSGVPNIAAVDGDGIVQKVWEGELDAESWKTVFQYFGFTGPSLSSESRSKS